MSDARELVKGVDHEFLDHVAAVVANLVPFAEGGGAPVERTEQARQLLQEIGRHMGGY